MNSDYDRSPYLQCHVSSHPASFVIFTTNKETMVLECDVICSNIFSYKYTIEVLGLSLTMLCSLIGRIIISFRIF